MMTLHLVCGIDAADTDEADEAECRAHSLTTHWHTIPLAHHSTTERALGVLCEPVQSEAFVVTLAARHFFR